MSNSLLDPRQQADTGMDRMLSGVTESVVPRIGAVFVVVLFGLVPALHAASGIPLLVLVGVVLSCALVGFVATGHFISGSIAALLVIGTMRADYPLVRGATAYADLDIWLADPFVAVIIACGAWWVYTDSPLRPQLGGHIATIAVFGLAIAWPIWAGVSAVFGAGPHPTTAMFFAVDQARLSVYLLAGVIIAGVISLRTVIVTIAIAGVGHAIVSIAQAVSIARQFSELGAPTPSNLPTIDVFGHTLTTTVATGGFVGPAVSLAAITLLSFAVALRYLITGRFWQRIVAGVAVIIVLFSLFLSQSDSVMIATPVVALGVVLIHVWPQVPEQTRERLIYRRREYGFLASFFVLIGLLLPWVIDIEAVTGVDSFYSRAERYNAAVAVALDNPVFGVGGANFQFVVESYGVEREIAAHSIFFEYLAATGFVGAAIYSLLIICVGWHAYAALTTASDEREIVALVCIWFLAFGLFAMLNLVWPRHSVMGTFWIVSGVLIGTAATPRRKIVPTKASEHQWHVLWYAASFIVGGVIVVLAGSVHPMIVLGGLGIMTACFLIAHHSQFGESPWAIQLAYTHIRMYLKRGGFK